ncbi:MAG: GcvT family protein [Acidimicrobiales bacterium]
MPQIRSGGPTVVIIGAGIVGCGVADELAARGVRNVTVVEQGPWPRPGGSTSHAPGGVFQTNPSETMTRFAAYTMARIDDLAAGGERCNQRVGSLEVATDTARWDELHRRCDWAQARGLDVRLIDGPSAAALHCLIDPERIIGAMHVPGDGWVRPQPTTAALAARSGARILADTPVVGITAAGRRVTGVETTRGTLAADVVVCCAGFWGPQVGALAGVAIPLQPMAHQYAVTGVVPALAAVGGRGRREVRQPFLRHQSARLYLREHGSRMGVGSYAHRPMPIDPALVGIGLVGMPSVLAFTPEDFEASWADAVALLPDLAATRPEEGINGVFSFTPDGAPLLGPAKELDGFWVAEAIWITHSLGAARAVAEGICNQQPTLDLHEMDLERFEPAARTPAAIRVPAVARFVEVYDIVHPLTPPREPRGLRVSAFHQRHREGGAVFGVSAGWERPQWYETNRALLTGADLASARSRGIWAGRHWSPIVMAEHRAGRQRAGLYDMTALRRLEVSGPGALPLLDRLTTTRMDRSPGSVSYTLMLNEHGGIRSDITVARLGPDRFWVGTNGPQDQVWLAQHARGFGAVTITDITGSQCCVGLWGPAAPVIIAELAGAAPQGRYFSATACQVGDVAVTALRLSYVGEMGWELYTSTEYGLRLWDLLVGAGANHGLVPVGRGALDAMRLEKGYRAWGRDMTAVDTPIEAGLAWAVDRSLDFVGRDALERRPVTRRLRTVTLDDPGRVVLGGEGVFSGATAVGAITSAGYGASIGRGLAYAWLPPELAETGTALQVAWFGERLDARVSDDALFDPDGRRVRGPLPEPAPASTPAVPPVLVAANGVGVGP